MVDARPRRVLFVDDETNILSGLRRRLRPLRDVWDVSFCESGHDALQLLDRQCFDVIVSDLRMPGMNGLELLGHVKAEYPEVVRLALSGEQGTDAELECSRIAQQFLAKPIDIDELKSVVARALDLRELLDDPQLRALIGGMDALPSVPETFQRVTSELESPHGSLVRVADIIAEDLGLTAKVLQLVNSAFFGIPQHVESVHQAVSMLGANTIRALVLSEQVLVAFPDAGVGGLDVRALALHGKRVGAVARALARHERAPRTMQDDALLAGMVEEVGRLVLAAGFPDAYAACARAVDAGEDLHVAERRAFRVAHDAVGAYLLGLWGLPDGIVEAVARHHTEHHAVGKVADLVRRATALADCIERHGDLEELACRDATGQHIWSPTPDLAIALRELVAGL